MVSRRSLQVEYSQYMTGVLEATPNLCVREGTVSELILGQMPAHIHATKLWSGGKVRDGKDPIPVSRRAEVSLSLPSIQIPRDLRAETSPRLGLRI